MSALAAGKTVWVPAPKGDPNLYKQAVVEAVKDSGVTLSTGETLLAQEVKPLDPADAQEYATRGSKLLRVCGTALRA